MEKLYKRIEFAILLFFPVFVFSQFDHKGHKGSDSATIKKETIIVFDNTRPSGLPATQYNRNPEKNILKFGFTGVVDGDFSGYYERSIIPNLSVEIGQGVTYTDYFFNIVHSIDIDNEHIQPQIGYAAKLALRFYPMANYAFDGLYLAPEFWYRDYKLNYQQQDLYGNYNGIFLLDKRTTVDYRLTVGFQNVDWIDYFSFDFYVGAAVRNTNWDRVVNVTTINPSTGVSQSTDVIKNEVSTKPVLSCGLKIGYYF